MKEKRKLRENQRKEDIKFNINKGLIKFFNKQVNKNNKIE